jgi:transcriptional activator of cad operon
MSSPSSPSSGREFRLEDWRVHPQLNTLVRSEKTITIEPKAMQVLVYLAERAGQVVTKDEFFEHVWEGAFVTDEALTYSIHELRKALGDDA